MTNPDNTEDEQFDFMGHAALAKRLVGFGLSNDSALFAAKCILENYISKEAAKKLRIEELENLKLYHSQVQPGESLEGRIDFRIKFLRQRLNLEERMEPDGINT